MPMRAQIDAAGDGEHDRQRGEDENEDGQEPVDQGRTLTRLGQRCVHETASGLGFLALTRTGRRRDEDAA